MAGVSIDKKNKNIPKFFVFKKSKVKPNEVIKTGFLLPKLC